MQSEMEIGHKEKQFNKLTLQIHKNSRRESKT